jgi:hypothetical protein
MATIGRAGATRAAIRVKCHPLVGWRAIHQQAALMGVPSRIKRHAASLHIRAVPHLKPPGRQRERLDLSCVVAQRLPSVENGLGAEPKRLVCNFAVLTRH